jgi:hypothetical protein
MSVRIDKKHRIVLTVRFDRPCTTRHAVSAVRDCIHGAFYPKAKEAGDPEQFDVINVSSVRVAKERR